MCREIRRVPPHWEHPRYTREDAPRPSLVGDYRPCHDQDYKTASLEWKEGFKQWEAGTHPEFGKWRATEFWEYAYPPDKYACRPAFTEMPTWYQVYETVSEGTPVTPAFETQEKLYLHLVTVGDDWAVNRGTGPFSRDAANAFVFEGGYAPSMIVIQSENKEEFYEGIEAAGALSREA